MNAPATMPVPEALRDDVAGYELAGTSLGEAAETYRLTARGRPTRYLKIAKELEREHARLRWAAGRLPVPRVLAFASEAGRAYLLLDELPGTPVELATELAVAERVAYLEPRIPPPTDRAEQHAARVEQEAADRRSCGDS